MRPARIRHGKAMAAKDSVPENHEGMRIRRRARTSGTAAPDAPGVSGADARDEGGAIPPVTSMENIVNQHVAARTFERSAPDDLDLDMSQLTVQELVTAFEGLRTLSHVTSGILGQPRCRNGVEDLFDGLWRRLNWEWDKAVQEIKNRVPANRHEKEARDYAIVANAIDQNSPIDECLADAQVEIDSKPLSAKVVDQKLEPTGRTVATKGSLMQAISAYWAGREAFNALPDLGDEAENDTAFAATYGLAVDVLEQWDRPAESREAAVEALKVANKEATDFKDSAIVGTMAAAALGFFENELAKEEANQVEKATPNENSFTLAAAEEAADRKWEHADPQPRIEEQEARSATTYSLDDLHSDVHHLHELLGAIKDILHEMPYERDGKRDVELDRVSALNWIATDRCHQLADLIEVHYAEIGTTCANYRSAKAS